MRRKGLRASSDATRALCLPPRNDTPIILRHQGQAWARFPREAPRGRPAGFPRMEVIPGRIPVIAMVSGWNTGNLDSTTRDLD